MTGQPRLTRRALLTGGAAVGAGLVIGFRVPFASAQQKPGVLAPNQWLRIDRDGVVTITNSVPEMGQGTLTSMPMIVADELDAAWDKIRVEQAPAN
ncbi:MAG TPA: molybdopterin cofactor-binding domain-containing protein, partial [Methylomirabilota bacterium]|nr:molybdopterin cofactor-binding domain-containing protein [Methylomirabilota bacterium]